MEWNEAIEEHLVAIEKYIAGVRAEMKLITSDSPSGEGCEVYEGLLSIEAHANRACHIYREEGR